MFKNEAKIFKYRMNVQRKITKYCNKNENRVVSSNFKNDKQNLD